jgi:hypothetical protein
MTKGIARRKADAGFSCCLLSFEYGCVQSEKQDNSVKSMHGSPRTYDEDETAATP